MSKLIPGVLERHDPTCAIAPVVLDSPHSGSQYPGDFGAALPLARLRAGEDAFVDELFGAAPAHGATLLRALFPRTYIDPNRSPDDVDESLLDGPWPAGARPGPKTALGIGLIPKRQPGGLVYDRRLTVREAERRLEHYYHPYHAELAAAIDARHADFGTVWHLDCHSMPALSTEVSPEGPGRRRPDFCLGDRDGETCEPAFTRHVAEKLAGLGYSVTINDPYKGVELIRRHADPARGRHSLQIEINRGLYMDERAIVRGPGFVDLRADLERLVASVCAYALERAVPDQAAE